MLLAEVTFPLAPSATAEALDAVTWVLACWLKNGQIEDDWELAETERCFVAFTLLPEADSLDQQHANQYVEGAIAALAEQGVSRPVLRVRGTSPDFGVACSCTTRPSLILFTSYLSKLSPVRCGACFQLVPLYRLPPVQDSEYLGILQWAADYRACDTLQMHCSTGERFAEGQLARHDSSLSRRGRAIADKLTQLVAVAVYYFLFKARGRNRATELRRKCPQCRSPWALEETWHGQFDFRCERCRLLSNVACSLVS